MKFFVKSRLEKLLIRVNYYIQNPIISVIMYIFLMYLNFRLSSLKNPLPYTLHKLFNFSFAVLLVLQISSCSLNRVSRSKDVTYLKDQEVADVPSQALNIFAPRKSKELNEVFIFIHGGNWNSGRKELYSFFGNRMARKGVVSVIIDYPLSPAATYKQMAMATAQAVSWVHENIEDFGGDPERIFVSGHSAGGHLAALVAVRDEYFSSSGKINPIKGTILIDAAGLDMYGYLLEKNYPADNTYIKTFTNDPVLWKEASPMYHLSEEMPKFLIFRGENTYPSIIKSTEKFVATLSNYVEEPNYTVQSGKKHFSMITQFFWTWNSNYDDMLEFMSYED